MEITKTSSKDIELILPLFEAYRKFYGQVPNPKASREFLGKRFSNKENVILLAKKNLVPMGFTQLYTTFSSVTLEPFYILNDLYVAPQFRGQGIGEALLESAKSLCGQKKYKGLALETALDNPAQKLYERLGWERDISYFHYFWTNNKNRRVL